jgi:hypothetical protein
MKKLAVVAWGALSSGLVVGMTTPSFADTSAAVEPSPAPAVTEKTTYRPPNLPIVIGGLVSFVGAYGASIAVAAANNTPADNNLYIPIAGPWLDLQNRPGCGSLNEPSCSREDGTRALLVVSGLFQGLGVLTVALGFVVPQKRHTVVSARAEKPSVHVFPAQVSRDGYGLAAAGRF